MTSPAARTARGRWVLGDGGTVATTVGSVGAAPLPMGSGGGSGPPGCRRPRPASRWRAEPGAEPGCEWRTFRCTAGCVPPSRVGRPQRVGGAQQQHGLQHPEPAERQDEESGEDGQHRRADPRELVAAGGVGGEDRGGDEQQHAGQPDPPQRAEQLAHGDVQAAIVQRREGRTQGILHHDGAPAGEGLDEVEQQQERAESHEHAGQRDDARSGGGAHDVQSTTRRKARPAQRRSSSPLP